MPAAVACPHCHQPLEIPRPAPEHFRCHHCSAKIHVAGSRKPRSVPEANAASTLAEPPDSAITATIPTASYASVANDTTASPGHQRRVLGIAGALVLVTVLCLSLLWAKSGDGNVELDIPPPDTGTLATKKIMDPRVKKAVDAGVAYLRKQMPAILKSHPGEVGLAGVVLLECGVPADDEQVRQLAEVARKSIPPTQTTYAAGPIIFFLDRLHQGKVMPEDERKRVETLALRLMKGQNRPINLWSYTIPVLDAKQEYGLLSQLRDKAPYDTTGGGADMSNTQFAALSLWSSRKSGVPVDAALKAAAATARKTQDPKTGTWGYSVAGGSFRDTGTCVGLILLALGRAVSDAKENTEFLEDPAVAKAVKHLGKVINRHVDAYARGKQGGKHQLVGADAHGDLYFLWTLERTCLILGLKALGEPEQDWHRWGTDILLDHQKDDGSWAERHGPVPDTCFALLFLMQANLFQDLTDKLQLGAAFSGSNQIGPANKQ